MDIETIRAKVKAGNYNISFTHTEKGPSSKGCGFGASLAIKLTYLKPVCICEIKNVIIA